MEHNSRTKDKPIKEGLRLCSNDLSRGRDPKDFLRSRFLREYKGTSSDIIKPLFLTWIRSVFLILRLNICSPSFSTI